ncbi:MAG: hypothetical protein P8J59_10505 [Phycisphaerales bacterium]|jgi:hypothetical protein|nr:hypothetical protein [Phycisphaerales bacterium]
MTPPSPTLLKRSVEPACLAVLVALLLVACDDSTPAPVSSATPPTNEPAAAELRRGYEIPISMVENWEGTQIRKYTYEMRFDADGKLHRNGWSQAFFSSGELEREGSYRFDPVESRSDRVGLWTYYAPDGSISRTEDRGGEPLWTAPDQRLPPPGTAP